jgi:hypothetical protein
MAHNTKATDDPPILPMNKKKVNPEVVVLDVYRKKPPAEFWESFPKAALTTEASTRVNVDKMQNMVDQNKGKKLPFQLRTKNYPLCQPALTRTLAPHTSMGRPSLTRWPLGSRMGSQQAPSIHLLYSVLEPTA